MRTGAARRGVAWQVRQTSGDPMIEINVVGDTKVMAIDLARIRDPPYHIQGH